MNDFPKEGRKSLERAQRIIPFFESDANKGASQAQAHTCVASREDVQKPTRQTLLAWVGKEAKEMGKRRWRETRMVQHPALVLLGFCAACFLLIASLSRSHHDGDGNNGANSTGLQPNSTLPAPPVKEPLKAKNRPLLFVGVVTAAHKLETRVALRETYMSSPLVQSGVVVVKFFVFSPPANDSTSTILADNEVHQHGEHAVRFEERNDFVVLEGEEDYYKIHLKTEAILHYGWKHAQAQFIMKTDDDTLVFPSRMAAFLEPFAVAAASAKPSRFLFAAGHVIQNQAVDRDPAHPHYIAPEVYGQSHYPPYLQGGGYVLSYDLAKRITKGLEAGQLSRFKLEDVGAAFWMHDLKNKYGEEVHIKHDKRFLWAGCTKDVPEPIFIHMVKHPNTIRCTWNNYLQDKENISSSPINKRSKSMSRNTEERQTQEPHSRHDGTGFCWTEETLPPELVTLVLGFLPEDMVAVASRTCRWWFACCEPGPRRQLWGQRVCSTLALLRWAMESQGYVLDERACAFAAGEGQMAVLQWARAQGCPWDHNTCNQAAANGRLEVLKWARENGCPWDLYTCVYAAYGGHVEVLQWARENGCDWHEEDVISNAAENGHFEVVKWARKHGCSWGGGIWACKGAAKAGHLAMLKWLRKHGCPWDGWTCLEAARCGHLEILKWARANGCPWCASTCQYTAAAGQLEALQWMREQGCPWDERTCDAAAEYGHMEVLKWAHKNGCPWGPDTCSRAAGNGQLRALQWARENGCPWNEDTCMEAGCWGHLEILKWARANGCPWDERTCASAALYGHLDVLKWARENGCPWNQLTCSEAAWSDNLEVLQWAREHGCPWDSTTCSDAAENGHLRVLQWARQNGCPWDERTCRNAVDGQHVAVLRWAREQGCPWDEYSCQWAIRNGYWDEATNAWK
ncbi:Ankyrin repeat-containing domain [Balamuthia mandrillaris]